MAIEVRLIDDDLDLSTMLRILLRGQDFQIKAVFSSEEEIEAVQDPEVASDIVIPGLLMPEVDGWEVCERIRSFSDVPTCAQSVTRI